MSKPAVRTEISGKTATVILSRPERRNAVDRPTAEALAEAFLAFDRNSDLSVAVLYGEEGAFCAGAGKNSDAARTCGGSAPSLEILARDSRVVRAAEHRNGTS